MSDTNVPAPVTKASSPSQNDFATGDRLASPGDCLVYIGENASSQGDHDHPLVNDDQIVSNNDKNISRRHDSLPLNDSEAG